MPSHLTKFLTWRALGQPNRPSSHDYTLWAYWFSVIVLTVLFPQLAQSQARSLHNYVALPASPTVAALGNYGNIPVGYHTGVPNVSVPLHQISLKGLTVPISLSYHSTGLLVDGRASDSGLGWSCNAGGVISRSILGGRVDFDGGYATRQHVLRRVPGFEPYLVDPYTQQSLQAYCDDAMEKNVDAEPDVHNYSFAGRSGKFVFDTLAQAHPIPFEALRIEHKGQAPDKEWYVITDENGNIFTFGYDPKAPTTYQQELSTTLSDPTCPSSLQQDNRMVDNGITSYFLTRITTPYRDTVEFFYDNVTVEYRNPIDLTQHQYAFSQGDAGCSPIINNRTCFTTTIHTSPRLQRIKHGREEVFFTYGSQPRLDLEGSRALTEIKVLYGATERARYTLHHSYFTSAEASSADWSTRNSRLVANRCFRLRLDSVHRDGQPPYRFRYNTPAEFQMPAIHSYAQDRWGYFNGRVGNSTLIVQNDGSGANRATDSLAVTFGMLQRLTYPTGGFNEFRYEVNRAYSARQDLIEYEQVAEASARPRALDCQPVVDSVFTLQEERLVRIKYYFPRGIDGSTFMVNGQVSLESTGPNPARIFLASSGGAEPEGEQYVTLGPGQYRARALVITEKDQDGNCLDFSAGITVDARKFIPPGNHPVGGCRIRTITGNGQNAYGKPLITRYVYVDSLGRSSAVVQSAPQFFSVMITARVVDKGAVICAYQALLQSSANQGSSAVVAYELVSTLADAGPAAAPHKRSYQYTSTSDITQNSNVYPYPPPTSYEWTRGRLVCETDFTFAGGRYLKLREKKYEYQINLADNAFSASPNPIANQAVVPAYRIYTHAPKNADALDGYNPNIYKILPYYHLSASIYLTKTTETTYQGNASTSTVKTFSYNDQNLLVRREKTQTSAGDTLVQLTGYSSDYEVASTTQDPQLRGLRRLQQEHRLVEPVEQRRYQVKASGQTLNLGHTLTSYRLFRGMALPAARWRSEGGGAFTNLSVVDPLKDSLVHDLTDRRLLTHDHYDAMGNAEQQTQGHGLAVSYGYSEDDVLLYSVENSTAQQAAYAGFETSLKRWQSTGTGGVIANEGYAGFASYQLSNSNLVCPNVPIGKYQITCWMKGSGSLTANGKLFRSVSAPMRGWYQAQAVIQLTSAGNIVVSGTAQIDELRLHPVGAQMTTYTHEPLVGVTSQTDPSGRTTSYEYDALGRLLRTRDEQGRILSQQQYHYARP